MKLDRIAELRNRHNITQENIAKTLGVARTTYAMYEQGHREMDYDLLIKLADQYQVSLDYLFNRTDNSLWHGSYTDDENEYLIQSLELYRQMKNKYF